MNNGVTGRRRVWNYFCIISGIGLFILASMSAFSPPSFMTRGVGIFGYSVTAFTMALCLGPSGIIGCLIFDIGHPLIMVGTITASFIIQWFLIWRVGRDLLKNSSQGYWIFCIVSMLIYVSSGFYALWFSGNVLWLNIYYHLSAALRATAKSRRLLCQMSTILAIVQHP